jgi:hypothetical protein
MKIVDFGKMIPFGGWVLPHGYVLCVAGCNGGRRFASQASSLE